MPLEWAHHFSKENSADIHWTYSEIMSPWNISILNPLELIEQSQLQSNLWAPAADLKKLKFSVKVAGPKNSTFDLASPSLACGVTLAFWVSKFLTQWNRKLLKCLEKTLKKQAFKSLSKEAKCEIGCIVWLQKSLFLSWMWCHVRSWESWHKSF